MSGWSKEAITFLIYLVQKHPLLYDPRNVEYHNRMARRAVLEQIKDSVSRVRPNTTVEEIKTRWNALRSAFSAELLKHNLALTGSASPEIQHVWYFEKMLFLKQYLTRKKYSTDESEPTTPTCRQSTEPIEQFVNNQNYYDDEEVSIKCEEVERTNESDYQQYFSPTMSPTPSTSRSESRTKKRGFIDETNFVRTVEEALKIIVSRQLSENEPETGDEIFGKFVTSQLRSIKSTTFKTLLKHKIMENIIDLQKQDMELT